MLSEPWKKLLISSLVIGHAVSLHEDCCEYIGHHLIKTRERSIMWWQLNEMGFKPDLNKLDKKNKWWLVQKPLRTQGSCSHLCYSCKKFRSLGFKGKELEDIMSLHTNPDPQTFKDHHLGSLVFEKTCQKWAVPPEVHEHCISRTGILWSGKRHGHLMAPGERSEGKHTGLWGCRAAAAQLVKSRQIKPFQEHSRTRAGGTSPRKAGQWGPSSSAEVLSRAHGTAPT